jgi:hypothetical protein
MDTFNPNQMPGMPVQTEKKSVGPLVAVIIILALIIVGGLYFLKERAAQTTYVPVPEGDSVTQSLKKQGTSDDLKSIEADLIATNVNNLDQGASAIQAELNAR